MKKIKKRHNKNKKTKARTSQLHQGKQRPETVRGKGDGKTKRYNAKDRKKESVIMEEREGGREGGRG